MMETENEKYRRVLNILRNSKPELGSTDDIENEVFKRISEVKQPTINLSEIIDFLFGWVYIGWVRQVLITASVLLVLIFTWQQTTILKRIELISNQNIIFGGASVSNPSIEIEKEIMIYKLSGRKLPSGNITISEKQMKQLLDSVNDLQVKYKDLINLIEDDPVLKNYLRKKLIENNHSKFNL